MPQSEDSGWSKFLCSILFALWHLSSMGIKSNCPRHKVQEAQIQECEDRSLLILVAQMQLLFRPRLWRPKSHHETSVFPFLSLPPTHPITASNIIHHLVFVAARIKEQTGEINNNCGVKAQDAIRIQRRSKYKHKQTIFILKDCLIPSPPSWSQDQPMTALRKEMLQH